MAKKLTPVRILLDFPLEGVSYRANQLVAFPVELAASLKAGGSVDDSAAAVEYCRFEGHELIPHVPVGAEPEPEQPDPEQPE